jgi:hypothetical protein
MVEPTHYVLPRGRNSMVKTADYFREQGGPGSDWGSNWVPVAVDNEPRFPQNKHTDPVVCGVENARRLASHLPPVKGWTHTREHPLIDYKDALEPSAAQRIAVGV